MKHITMALIVAAPNEGSAWTQFGSGMPEVVHAQSGGRD